MGEEESMITDLETWLLDNGDRIFRYLVYKRMFTPYEQQQAYMDETQFESARYQFGFIEEAIDLGNGEWLIGIREIADNEVLDSLSYYKLSEIRLSYFECDQNMLRDEEDEGDDE